MIQSQKIKFTLADKENSAKRRVARNLQWGNVFGVLGHRAQPTEAQEFVEEPPSLGNFATFVFLK